MGIIDDTSPSLLINKAIGVPTYAIPRALAEVEKERKDSKGRIQYQRNLEENRTQWEAKMKQQAEDRRKHRTEEGAVSGSS